MKADSHEKVPIRRYPTGSAVFRQGDPGNEIYLLKEGRVELVHEAQGVRRTLAVFGSGEILGEMSVITGRPREATARVVADAEIVPIDRATFEAMIQSNLEVAVRIIRKLASRLDDVTQSYLAQHAGLSEKEVTDIAGRHTEAEIIPLHPERSTPPEPASLVEPSPAAPSGAEPSPTALSHAAPSTTGTPPATEPRRRIWIAVAVLVVLAALTVAAFLALRPSEPAPVSGGEGPPSGAAAGQPAAPPSPHQATTTPKPREPGSEAPPPAQGGAPGLVESDPTAAKPPASDSAPARPAPAAPSSPALPPPAPRAPAAPRRTRRARRSRNRARARRKPTAPKPAPARSAPALVREAPPVVPVPESGAPIAGGSATGPSAPAPRGPAPASDVAPPPSPGEAEGAPGAPSAPATGGREEAEGKPARARPAGNEDRRAPATAPKREGPEEPKPGRSQEPTRQRPREKKPAKPPVEVPLGF